MGARVRCRATWLLGAAACVPPPVFLPLLGPVRPAQLLRAARGNYQGRQAKPPHPTRIPRRPIASPTCAGESLHAQLLRPSTFRSQI